ncbi:MAG: hypothetical protein ACRDYZ_05210 [Acidimicrobiales bacterium]
MLPAGPIADVDCGTNSTRLLVVDPDGAPLARSMRITRLGQGVDATGGRRPGAARPGRRGSAGPAQLVDHCSRRGLD